MNALNHRIKRIEEAAYKAGGNKVAYIWIEPDEIEAVALERWRKENPGKDEPALLVFLVSWANERNM